MTKHNKHRVNFAKIVGGIGKEVGHIAKEVVEEPGKVLKTGLHEVGGIAGELSLPLLVIGGVVLFVYIKNK